MAKKSRKCDNAFLWSAACRTKERFFVFGANDGAFDENAEKHKRELLINGLKRDYFVKLVVRSFGTICCFSDWSDSAV